MIGIISGAIASMIFVIYLIKIGRFAKKNKRMQASGMKSSPNGSNKSTVDADSGCDEDKFV